MSRADREALHMHARAVGEASKGTTSPSGMPYLDHTHARKRREQGTYTHSELIMLTDWMANTALYDGAGVALAVEKPWKYWPDFEEACQAGEYPS